MKGVGLRTFEVVDDDAPGGKTALAQVAAARTASGFRNEVRPGGEVRRTLLGGQNLCGLASRHPRRGPSVGL
jgi:hypothetical protein